jgi:adenosyl cobinamide kinase/adenosyl cobinamide phosphate guanylyltransferase
MITLLTGGARSGKSTLAVQLGKRFDGDVVFIATAEAGDGDMAERIRRHRHERPDWETVEEPIHVVTAVGATDPAKLVIVDCITLWIANLMTFASDDAICDGAELLNGALAGRSAVLVTNEVGLGVHPETELGRHYRDLLGRVNQILARAADRTLLMVAGRATELSPADSLEP